MFARCLALPIINYYDVYNKHPLEKNSPVHSFWNLFKKPELSSKKNTRKEDFFDPKCKPINYICENFNCIKKDLRIYIFLCLKNLFGFSGQFSITWIVVIDTFYVKYCFVLTQ